MLNANGKSVLNCRGCRKAWRLILRCVNTHDIYPSGVRCVVSQDDLGSEKLSILFFL